MANYMALLNASDGVTMDLSAFIGGLRGASEPDFPTPGRDASRSETFLAAGQYIGHTHDTVREIIVPIMVIGGYAGITETRTAVETKWTQIVAALQNAAGLAVQLDGLAAQVIYTLCRDVRNKATSTAHRLQAPGPGQLIVLGRLQIEAQPYTRNGTLSAFTPFES